MNDLNGAANDEDDDFIEVIADVRSHDRVPRPEQICSLSDDEIEEKENADITRRVESPLRRNSDSDVLECPICFESVDSEGEHRVVATRCGHIFGSRCLRTVYGSHHKYKCPICQKKQVSGQEIKLFNVSIKVCDASVIEGLKQKHTLEIDKKTKDLTTKAKYISRLEQEKVEMMAQIYHHNQFMQQHYQQQQQQQQQQQHQKSSNLSSSSSAVSGEGRIQQNLEQALLIQQNLVKALRLRVDSLNKKLAKAEMDIRREGAVVNAQIKAPTLEAVLARQQINDGHHDSSYYINPRETAPEPQQQQAVVQVVGVKRPYGSSSSSSSSSSYVVI